MARPRMVDTTHPHDGRVYVLDAKHQSFNGEIYSRRTGGSYARNVNIDGVRHEQQLHIDVWKHYCGEIPEGYVVHHEHRNPDGTFDKSENNIEWLRLMTNEEHASYHNLNRPPVERECAWCGKPFITTSSNRKYCSDKCRGSIAQLQRRIREKKIARRADEAYEAMMSGKPATADPPVVKNE